MNEFLKIIDMYSNCMYIKKESILTVTLHKDTIELVLMNIPNKICLIKQKNIEFCEILCGMGIEVIEHKT